MTIPAGGPIIFNAKEKAHEARCQGPGFMGFGVRADPHAPAAGPACPGIRFGRPGRVRLREGRLHARGRRGRRGQERDDGRRHRGRTIGPPGPVPGPRSRPRPLRARRDVRKGQLQLPGLLRRHRRPDGQDHDRPRSLRFSRCCCGGGSHQGTAGQGRGLHRQGRAVPA
ncbi:MAG: hypothetical protein MZV64_10745 [Ignavibacteriales bacterium]|nr:hypothetical protein [Ignavibacteriales bacterium]